jgi:hypothetical protein
MTENRYEKGCISADQRDKVQCASRIHKPDIYKGVIIYLKVTPKHILNKIIAYKHLDF